MSDYLLDTDVLIDHLRASAAVPVSAPRTAYSTLTRAELYAGRMVDEAVVDALLGLFAEIPIDRSIAEEAGRIRRTTAVPLADAIIAATAITSGRTLVTRNLRHFEAVSGLLLHRA